MQVDPARNLGLIRVTGTGRTAPLLWGYSDGGKFTSEFPAHLPLKTTITDGQMWQLVHHFKVTPEKASLMRNHNGLAKKERTNGTPKGPCPAYAGQGPSVYFQIA